MPDKEKLYEDQCLDFHCLFAHWQETNCQEPLDFIFCRVDGQPLCYKTCHEHLYQAMDEVGIERQPCNHGYHLLRHSAATLLHKKSRDLKAVQSLLRHANIATTANIYIHPDGKVVSEGIEALTEEILPNCDLVVTEKSEMVN